MISDALFEEWRSNCLGERYVVSTNKSLLTVSKGYGSKNDVVFNETLNQIVLNEGALSQGDGLANWISKFTTNKAMEAGDIEAEIKRVMSASSRINDKLFGPIKISDINDILLSEMSNDEKIKVITQVTENLFYGKGGLDITLSVNGLANNLGLIDWEKTLLPFTALEIIDFFFLIKGEVYTTLPTDFRRVEKILERERFDLKFLLSHPTIMLLKNLKFKRGITVPELLPDSFEALIEPYSNAITGKGVKASRNQLCSLLQKLKQEIGRVLLGLAYEDIIFLPYKTPNLSPKGDLTGVLNFDTQIGQLVDKLLDTTIDRGYRSKCKVFLRSIYSSSNIRHIEDIPLHWPLDISNSLKKYNNVKGYSTATGFPLFVLKDMCNLYEDLNPDRPVFDRSHLSPAAAKIRNKYNENKDKYSFPFAVGYIGNEIIQACKEYVNANGIKHNFDAFQRLLKWAIGESNNEIRYQGFKDFSSDMFLDPAQKRNVKNTYHEYLNNNVESLSTRRAEWTSVYKLFNVWASKHAIDTKMHTPIPLEKSSAVYRSNERRTKSVRQAMPSALHALCVEELTNNDYEICDHFKNEHELKNNQTGNRETVLNKTTARCLHFLLLVPLRGYQARWLDEGLLDNEIWDFERGCYVKNNHPLKNYSYEDGTTHSERYSKTGVLRGDTGELELYISTNKTQMSSLVKKGHTGYTIPWPSNTGISNIDDIWDIIDEQLKFNKKYAPKVTIPTRVTDENKEVYKPSDHFRLPYFVPLFRRFTPSISKSDPSRYGLYLPITGDSIRNLFYEVLKRAERRYKDMYPQFESQSVAFDSDDNPLFDVHSLRVFGVTELIENGVDLEIVQMIVGHSVAVMTAYYNKMRSESFKALLEMAKSKQGLALENQKELYERYEAGDAEVLISLFELVSEWHQESSSKNGNSPAPIFTDGGTNRVVNGGICASFDCKSGGVKVKAVNKGIKYEITTVQGGDFRCGNCRYWQSGPRFLLEQIYSLNLVAEEIEDIVAARDKCMSKMREAYENIDLEKKHFVAETWERQADEESNKLAYRVTELSRRQAMLKASMEKAEVNDKQLSLMNIGADTSLTPDIDGKWSNLSLFDACIERTTQAAVLQLPTPDIETSMLKLEKFVNGALVAAEEGKNPFIFRPNDEVKRVALLYALSESCRKLGRTFTDEEFNNPLLLQETLGLSNLKKYVGDTLSLKNNSDFLLES